MMGKLQMDREWTEQDLRAFAEGAQAAFETVLLDELPQNTGWQDEGLQVSYSLCNGRVSCVLHRTVRADGKLWRITMSAPLAGNLLPEERMSARERELERVVRACQPFEEVIHTQAGCTVSNHCGPGCMGILYYHK